MGYWAVVVAAERYEAERLSRHETLRLPDLEPAAGPPAPAPGDRVVLVADTRPPVVFGLATVARARPLELAYLRRGRYTPRPAEGPDLRGPLTALDERTYAAVATRLGQPADRRAWLVSVNLPIEAVSAAEAVREFWSYLGELGPDELPTFVAPVGDELALQAYVAGQPTSLDPESDDE